MTIDERTRAALGRLTENEKACLRRRLLHQTAKEMAIELGISPHAVEKRLKMARTKLGLSSSLQAARMLAGYEQTVPEAPDLAGQHEPDQVMASAPGKRRRTLLISGIIIMSLILATLFALTPAAQDAPKPQSERVPATPETAAAFLGSSFDTMDRNKSGYLEADEMPRTTQRSGSGPAEPIESKRAQAMFVARHDLNGDGKVSRAEFIEVNKPVILANGIPARWKPKS